MKQKEIKNLAQKIAKLEIAAQNSSDAKAKSAIEEEIFKLSSHVNNIEDMIAVDDLVQEILNKNS